MTMAETELDIVTLVGELPAEACEHENHSDIPSFHADGNEQYVRLSLPCGCTNTTVIWCGKYIRMITRLGSNLVECVTCETKFELRETFFPLGPVRQFQP